MKIISLLVLLMCPCIAKNYRTFFVQHKAKYNMFGNIFCYDNRKCTTPNPSTKVLTFSLYIESVMHDENIMNLDISGLVVENKKPSIDISLLKKEFYALRYTNKQKETYVPNFVKI